MARPRGHKLDSTDINIIKNLQQNPRIGFRELGEIIGLKYSPCRRRVNKLLEEGYVSISVSIYQEKFSRKLSSCVLVEMADTSHEAIGYFSEYIRTLKEVDLCWEINGAWDFVVRLHVENETQFEPLRKKMNDLAMNEKKIVLRTQSYPITEIIKGRVPIDSIKPRKLE